MMKIGHAVNVKTFWVAIFALAALILLPCPAFATNVLTNPGFEDGDTSSWYSLNSTINTTTATIHSGTYSALVTDRTDAWNGIAQSLMGKINENETFSITGWARIQNASSANIKINIKQTDDAGINYHHIVGTTVNDSGWTIISGFFTLEVTGTLTDLMVSFRGPDPGVNFYIDDVTVTITNNGDWLAEANDRIEQIRKDDFRITAISPHDNITPVENVNIDIQQTRHHFPFGSAINKTQITNTDYLNFFKDHFQWAVMENASKWYANEPSENNVTYADADNIYNFCSANNITMRGHCIFWTSEIRVQDWVKALPYAPLPATSELRTAVEDRLDSAVNYFKGKFVHWDVNNEMCNNSWFKDHLGDDIRDWMFQAANAIDPDCELFLNDYNVISGGYNLNSYKQMAYDFQAQGTPFHGLGVQCHMRSTFDPAIVKGRFDSVAELNLPIWVTEFDISDPNENIRADKLEEFYRIAFSHPSVEGILMWGFWENQHWKEDAYLVNADWTLNAAGLRYEALMNEWTTNDSAITDLDGNADFRGFFGTYTVTLSPQGADPTVVTIELTPDGPTQFDVILDDIAELIPPGAPTNLTAVGGDETVVLQWDDNTEPDLAGYNIYRSVTPQTGYTKLNDSILALSEYTDNDVTNYASYFYVVTAINTNSDESGNSNQVSATPNNTTVIQLTSEDFESGFGDWLNISGLDTHDWFDNSGNTPTGDTGPESGAGGSQWYVYLECSVNDGGANKAGNNAILLGPELGGLGRVLTFDYHMFGIDIGSLNVDVMDEQGTWHDAVWTLSGTQQTSSSDPYRQATIDLSEYTGLIQIRFRAVAAGGTRGDMAIDNIEVTGITVYGDLNADNTINIDDLSEFAGYWLLEECIDLDLNGDCVIDFNEFAELAENWQKSF